MKYAKFSDEFLSYFRLDDNGETLVLTDKRGYSRAVKLLIYEERLQGDLIGREALKKKAETITLWNGDVRRFVSYETIDNAPTVDIKDEIAGAYNEGYACGSRENERPQGECKACDYYKLAQSFINGIVEVINKNGLTSLDELLETLNREAKNDG